MNFGDITSAADLLRNRVHEQIATFSEVPPEDVAQAKVFMTDVARWARSIADDAEAAAKALKEPPKP